MTERAGRRGIAPVIRRSLALAVLAGVLGPIAVSAQGATARPPPADSLSISGWAAYRADSIPEAAARFTLALRLCPTHDDATVGRAFSALRLGVGERGRVALHRRHAARSALRRRMGRPRARAEPPRRCGRCGGGVASRGGDRSRTALGPREPRPARARLGAEPHASREAARGHPRCESARARRGVRAASTRRLGALLHEGREPRPRAARQVPLGVPHRLRALRALVRPDRGDAREHAPRLHRPAARVLPRAPRSQRDTPRRRALPRARRLDRVAAARRFRRRRLQRGVPGGDPPRGGPPARRRRDRAAARARERPLRRRRLAVDHRVHHGSRVGAVLGGGVQREPARRAPLHRPAPDHREGHAHGHLDGEAVRLPPGLRGGHVQRATRDRLHELADDGPDPASDRDVVRPADEVPRPQVRS